MKRILALFLTFIITVATLTSCSSSSCDYNSTSNCTETVECEVLALDFFPLSDGTYAVSSGNAIYLKNIVIPEIYNGKKVTTILNKGFGCDYLLSIDNRPIELISITLPDSITNIGEFAFAYCDSLTSINIPDSVTSIGYRAFKDCKSLASITIGKGVTHIVQELFDNCTGLTSVTIPNTVTIIDNSVFSNCTSLTTINYCGTEEQWNAISKGEYWNSGVPGGCEIIFNYTGE